MADRKKRLASLRERAGRNKAPAITEDEPEQDVAGASSGVTGEKDVDASDPSLLLDKGGNDDNNETKKRSRQDNDDGNNDDEVQPKKKSALEEALEQAQKELKTGGAAPITTNDTQKSTNDAELTAMAPKKINWDLKRDIQPKLDKLEKRTQKAIVQLLRERLAREADAAAEDDEGPEDLD